MKNLRLLASMIAFFFTTASFAQSHGNPLRDIPVTDMTSTISNATISIDDFFVENGQVWVTSTLNGTVGGQPVEQTVSYPLSIEEATCNKLVLSPGVLISEGDFWIANFAVTINSSQSTDNRLHNALCSIAESKGKNASPYVLIAKLKQAVRALV